MVKTTMTFYFKPPRGDIPLHKMQECLDERLRYLAFLKKSEKDAENQERFKFEYLTDGSALDRTGHFMLRLLALKINGLKELIINSEPILFEKRLKSLKYSQVKIELGTAIRHAKEILSSGCPLPKYELFLQNFLRVLEAMLSSRAFSHTFGINHHSNSCSLFKLNAPFTLCLSLVATRDVELRAGNAVIPCGKWTTLLYSLFVEHIKLGMLQLSLSNAFKNIWDDDRVKYLYGVFKVQFETKPSNQSFSSSNHLTLKAVNTQSQFFPPCMRNFHSTLRLRHRLSHHSRFYYSLFLKDAGMSITDSIDFWSEEYSKAGNNTTCCSHSWQRDSKKYIYSIRHLYGLEGSRRVYNSPKCHFLQEVSLGLSPEGGCPFVHFDLVNLLRSFNEKLRTNTILMDTILKVKTEEGTKEACKIYLQALKVLVSEQSSSGQNLSEESTSKYFSSPVEFYYQVQQFFDILQERASN